MDLVGEENTDAWSSRSVHAGVVSKGMAWAHRMPGMFVSVLMMTLKILSLEGDNPRTPETQTFNPMNTEAFHQLLQQKVLLGLDKYTK